MSSSIRAAASLSHSRVSAKALEGLILSSVRISVTGISTRPPSQQRSNKLHSDRLLPKRGFFRRPETSWLSGAPCRCLSISLAARISERHRPTFDRYSIAHSRRSYHAGPAGAEPGIDVATQHERPKVGKPDRDSEITVVDFSEERVEQHDCAQDSLTTFLTETPKPDWSACRWIYVNGLNWDILRSLGQEKGLHPLAIEDVLSSKSRTKVDWYDGHLCAILTLQRLVDSLSTPASPFDDAGPAEGPTLSHKRRLRTLFGPNQERTRSLEKRSALALHQQLAVRIEQVSIFLTVDGTVITIFDTMGKEVLKPILARLHAPGTILRSSNDASMLLYAVIDALVDMAIPIAGAYDEEIRHLEGDLLAKPKVSQSLQLYALRSELALLDSIIKPIDGMISTLRDHQPSSLERLKGGKDSAQPPTGPQSLSRPPSDRLITPLTQMYLADVHDHVVIVTDSLRKSIGAVQNLTSLIFNTISARQNESIRQLTLVTIFFLPLTFLTGYFGMNFDPFPAVNQHSDMFFWYLAFPVMLTTSLFLARRHIAGRFGRRLRFLGLSRRARR